MSFSTDISKEIFFVQKKITLFWRSYNAIWTLWNVEIVSFSTDSKRKLLCFDVHTMQFERYENVEILSFLIDIPKGNYFVLTSI